MFGRSPKPAADAADGASSSPAAQQGAFGAKNIGYWSSCCLNLNNVMGAAIVALPLVNQQAGTPDPDNWLKVMSKYRLSRPDSGYGGFDQQGTKFGVYCTPLNAGVIRLGDRVRAARAQRGMSRKILARDSGVSERYLAQLESGRGNPSVAVLHQIADAMDMSVMELADPHGGTDPALAEIQALLAPLAPAELSEAAELLERRFAGSGTRGRRISLIGLRGAGKTTLGKALADALGFPFIELNREIERDYGASIGEIEITSMISAISFVAAAPVCRSRMIARGSTISAAPPKP